MNYTTVVSCKSDGWHMTRQLLTFLFRSNLQCHSAVLEKVCYFIIFAHDQIKYAKDAHHEQIMLL